MGYYRELQEFQDAVRKLSVTVQAASALWKDEHFSQLSASVVQIANMSRNVIEAGERSKRSAEEFDRIANERY